MEITQQNLEEVFSKKSTRDYIFELLMAEPATLHMIGDGIDLITAWAQQPATYKTKQQRKDAVLCMDIQDIVEKIFIDVLLIKGTSTLATMSSQLGQTLGFADTREGITLAAELLAVMLPIGLYSIAPLYEKGQYHIIPNLVLNTEQRLVAERGMYIPPSITKPLNLKSNRDSGYATLKGQSLILGGAYKHHEGDICLDVLNKQNKIKLCINEEFLERVPETRKKDLEDIKKDLIEKGKKGKELQDALRQEEYNWFIHCELSSMVYNIMLDAGNKFYVTNKVDMRGRVYSQGHHVNPMGASFKKSMIELSKKETVEVPDGFFS